MPARLTQCSNGGGCFRHTGASARKASSPQNVAHAFFETVGFPEVGQQVAFFGVCTRAADLVASLYVAARVPAVTHRRTWGWLGVAVVGLVGEECRGQGDLETCRTLAPS